MYLNSKKAYRKLMLCALVSLVSLPTFSNDWYQLINLKGSWKFAIGDNKNWAKSPFNDSNWEIIRVPAAWEDHGFHGYDGFAWYRRNFDGNSLIKGKSHYLWLGYIDDADEVYVNGHLIGASGSFPPNFSTAYNAFRKYLIPANLINYDGSNLIAVRVFDVVNVGGIVSGDVGIYTQKSSILLEVDLQGLWSFSKGDNPAWKHRYLKDDGWKKIMVPSPWENQGIGDYDGYAWYRKKFIPSADIATDLVLIMGKIDDFDQVYLNGVLIGSTNDNRRFGSSESYDQLRIYKIPKGVLKPSQQNTIAVRVYDMGHNGGIYEGPIGLIKESEVTRFLRSR